MRFIAGKINELKKKCCITFPLDSHDIVFLLFVSHKIVFSYVYISIDIVFV